MDGNRPAWRAASPARPADQHTTGEGMGKSIQGMADTRDMITVHSGLRREFGLMPGLVSRVDRGDAKRARIVADHISLWMTMVYAHHHSEDKNVWPKLLERVPDTDREVIRAAEAQHHGLDETGEEVNRALVAWRRDAASDSAPLLEALDAFTSRLIKHMDLEEARILPLAEQHLTAAEWMQLGPDSMKKLPKSKVPMFFGCAAFESDPEVLQEILASIPPIPRFMMTTFGPRAYASYSKRVHGTPTPTASPSPS
jgi:hemerythrin-like domain-containing protein